MKEKLSKKASHPADRMIKSIERLRAPVCVGLDPIADKLPNAVGDACGLREGRMDPLVNYCMGVLEAVAPYVPCVKFQSACFERYRGFGISALAGLVKYAHDLKLEVILDAKRGDIGVTAEHYAASAFDPLGPESLESVSDWLTINSYLGEDGIRPFLQNGRSGAFALVRTSNPGGDAIQNLQLKDGRTVAEAVAAIIATVGKDHIGSSGYSALGAVVGATKPQDAKRLRSQMPQQVFLVPGFGAQGARVDDVLPCFNSGGKGAIVSASRSVIYAFKRDDPEWSHAVADAAAGFAEEVGAAVGLR